MRFEFVHGLEDLVIIAVDPGRQPGRRCCRS